MADLGDWQQEWAANGVNEAGRIYDPYRNYIPSSPSGSVAGFTPDQNYVFGRYRDMAGTVDPAAGQNVIKNAIGLGGQNYNPMAVSPMMMTDMNMAGYMNPYTENVVQATRGQMESARDEAMNTMAAQHAGARSFGDRRAVAEGQMMADYTRDVGSMAANLYNQNFLNAQQMANQDITRNLQAQSANQNAWSDANAQNRANAVLALQGGTALDNMAQRNLGNLYSAGSAQQGLAQRELDIPMEMFDRYYAAMTGVPYSPSAGSDGPSGLQTAIGLGLGVGGLGTSGGGTILGDLLGL